MLHRFVLHSAHSGRTSECCVRGPVSLSPLQAAARDLLAAESDPASASAPLPLLSYSDEHDPHNTVDSEKELKELITIKREEKERREAGLKQEQEAAAAAGAAPEASPSHELSDSILIVEHPQEGKQTEEEITIDLIVRQTEPNSPMAESDSKQGQAVGAPSSASTLPPGGPIPASASPAAVTVPGPESSSAGPVSRPSAESKEELEHGYALINQQGEIDEGDEAKEDAAHASDAAAPPAGVFSAVKRKMSLGLSKPDLPFVMIEQQLAQWSKDAYAWTAEVAQSGWQASRDGLQSARQQFAIPPGVVLRAIVAVVLLTLTTVFLTRLLVPAPSRALVAKEAALIDLVSSQSHRLEELEHAMQAIQIRDEMREYQAYRAARRAEEEAEEERKNQLSERFKSAIHSAGESVAHLAEAAGEQVSEFRRGFAEMCEECKEDWAELAQRVAPLRRSIADKFASVASGLRWFRDEAQSYIRYGVDVPFTMPPLVDKIIASHNERVNRMLGPMSMDGDKEASTNTQILRAQALLNILKEKGIDMD